MAKDMPQLGAGGGRERIRGMRPIRSAAQERMDEAWDKLKAVLARTKDQEAADRARRNLTVFFAAVDREARKYVDDASNMPEDLVLSVLDTGSYRLQNADAPLPRSRSRARPRARPSENT